MRGKKKGFCKWSASERLKEKFGKINIPLRLKILTPSWGNYFVEQVLLLEYKFEHDHQLRNSAMIQYSNLGLIGISDFVFQMFSVT